MTATSSTPFQRLLADAQHGGQAKVDALVALSQRTVHVPTWGQEENANFRTLTNANGQTALPIFSSKELLDSAATQFGWLNAQGGLDFREIGARAALNYAVGHNLHFVVVDISSSHSLDIDREEIEPLLSPAARRESTGPFSGVGRVSSTIMQAVKPSSAAANRAVQPQEPPDHTAQARAAAAAGAAVTARATNSPEVVTTFGGGSSVNVQKLTDAPSDALLDALAAVLRGYPEAEWAAICAISRGPAAALPTVGLKVDTSFRQRVNEIVASLREAGDAHGASLDVLLLDDPAVMRTVRAEAKLFYPWKR